MALRRKIIIASFAVLLGFLVLIASTILFTPLAPALFWCSSDTALVSLLPFKKLGTIVDGTKFSIKYPMRLTASSFLNTGNISFRNMTCSDSGAAFSVIFLPKQALIPGELAAGDNDSLMRSYVAHMRGVAERQLQRSNYTAELAEKTYGANTFYVFTESYEEPAPYEGMTQVTNREFFKVLESGKILKITASVGPSSYFVTLDELHRIIESVSVSLLEL